MSPSSCAAQALTLALTLTLTLTLTLALTLALALALTVILNHNPSRNLALAFRPPLPLTGPDEDPLKWTDARPLMQAIDT